MSADEIRQLVQQRLAQARTALDDAKFLLDGGRSPQSIINRSYYAMFYAVLALLQAIGKAPSKHAGVISLFDREFVRQGDFDKKLSKDLHKAFELRQRYDYRGVGPSPSPAVGTVWATAADFVHAVEQYINERDDPSSA